MQKFQELVDRYWKYYLALEDGFLETERYVEFDVINNGKVYSMEYMMLFQTICSEIDVVGKAYASMCDAKFKATKYTGLNEWWFHITKNDQSLMNRCIVFRNKNKLQPWKNYCVIENKSAGKKYVLNENAKTPMWWNAYNGVKHDRAGDSGNNYMYANFQNVLTAFSALYILESRMLESQFDPDNDRTLPMRLESKLFDEHLRFYTDYTLAVLG